MPRISHHVIKSHHDSFVPMLLGNRHHTLRFNDRGYEVGDTVTVVECGPDDLDEPHHALSGNRRLTTIITDIYSGARSDDSTQHAFSSWPRSALLDGWVILTLKEIHV